MDLEPIEKRETYAGRRVHRGERRRSHAELNGRHNIIRKEVPYVGVVGVRSSLGQIRSDEEPKA